MSTIKLGEVEITRVIEIPRSTYPTASMLPTSDAAVIASNRGRGDRSRASITSSTVNVPSMPHSTNRRRPRRAQGRRLA